MICNRGRVVFKDKHRSQQDYWNMKLKKKTLKKNSETLAHLINMFSNFDCQFSKRLHNQLASIKLRWCNLKLHVGKWLGMTKKVGTHLRKTIQKVDIFHKKSYWPIRASRLQINWSIGKIWSLRASGRVLIHRLQNNNKKMLMAEGVKMVFRSVNPQIHVHTKSAKP